LLVVFHSWRFIALDLFAALSIALRLPVLVNYSTISLRLLCKSAFIFIFWKPYINKRVLSQIRSETSLVPTSLSKTNFICFQRLIENVIKSLKHQVP
jgi:hypothetical protein